MMGIGDVDTGRDSGSRLTGKPCSVVRKKVQSQKRQRRTRGADLDAPAAWWIYIDPRNSKSSGPASSMSISGPSLSGLQALPQCWLHILFYRFTSVLKDKQHLDQYRSLALLKALSDSANGVVWTRFFPFKWAASYLFGGQRV